MKNSEQHYIAVDFGSTQIRTLLAEVMENNLVRVLSFEAKNASDIKNGIIEQHTGAAFKAGGLIKLLHNSSKISGKIGKFSTSLNARGMKVIEHSFVHRFRKSEEIDQRKLNEFIKEVRHQIETEDISVYNVIPVRYKFDGEITEEPIGMNVQNVEIFYHLVIGPEKIQLNLDKCTDRMPGLIHEGDPSQSMEALSIAVTEEEERRNGCALINFGATTTTLALYSNEVLQELVVVPLGGMTITHDIVEFGITEIHAEKLKCLKGYASEQFVEEPVNIQIPNVNPGEPPVTLSTSFLATMIEARLEELLEPIFAEIAAHADDIQNIIITGGASQLQMLPEFINQQTGLEVRYGDHTGWLTPDTPEEFRDMEYAQLIGTVLLADEYRTTHAVDDKKSTGRTKKKSEGPKIADKLAQGIFRLFEDDPEL